MPQPSLEIQGSSIVLLGNFNPAIFQPAWFAAHELLSKAEAEAAEIEIIHAEIVQLRAGWLDLNVTHDRFQASTSEAPTPALLRDLVAGTFEILSSTPLRAMGLNRDAHFRMSTEHEWHDFGHRLAPPEHWVNLLVDPGLLSLTMQGVRTDDFPGYVRVLVQPSARLANGVYVGVNDHYAPIEGRPDRPALDAMRILERQWDASQSHSEGILRGLMEPK